MRLPFWCLFALLLVAGGPSGRLETAAAQAPAPPASQTPQAPQTPPPPPDQPIFRGGVNLVRVDVSVVGRGDEPVADLEAGDFEILEDEIPQKVETVQFVKLDGHRHEETGESLDIRSREHAAVEAAKEDVRLFAIFLDDYHVDKAPTIMLPLRRALERFIRNLGPYDLVVIMDPLTTLDGLRFTRSKEALIERVQKFEGRRGEIFPIKSRVEEDQASQRNIWELRGAVTLTALEALATHLGGLREGRKSILLVSQGPPVGMPGSPNYGRLEDALRAANRGNVTVNVLDPRPLGYGPFRGSDSNERLSRETGGIQIHNTNDPTEGLQQVIREASAYYLVGYTPSRGALSDGKFHKIGVRVKRSGVRVSARRGYWAPTAKEANAEPAPPPDPHLTGALTTLAAPDEGRMVDLWIGTAPGEGGSAELAISWEPAPSRANDVKPERLQIEPVRKTDGQPLAEPQAVAATIRSMDEGTLASFAVPAGVAALKITAYGRDSAVIDRWTQALTIPDYSRQPIALSTPRFLIARSAFEARALEKAAAPTPTATRRFRRTDRLYIDLACRGPEGEPLVLSAALTNREGRRLVGLDVPPLVNGRARLIIPLTSLAFSTYVLRVDAKAGEHEATQMAAFTVGQ
jgi:VWFA-related protein